MSLISCDCSSLRTGDVRRGLILDIFALAVVFFTPAIAHLIRIPFYMIEPMRLMIMLSIAHSTRFNTLILALSLPLFSWAVSGHPELFKMMIMTGEMVVNVLLYYYLVRKNDSVFLSMIISIIFSKVLCYSSYLVFFSMMFLREEADPAFLISQVVTTLIFSSYVAIILRKKSY
jgi:hypothetical protein